MEHPQPRSRQLHNWRVPDAGCNNDPAKELILKKKLIQFIEEGFFAKNTNLKIDEDLKKKLSFCFNWILGKEIDISENKGLLFTGDVGLCKSCILEAIHKMIIYIYPYCNSRFITANKLASYFRNTKDEQSIIEINKLIYCRILFIDDIGTEDKMVYKSFPIQEIIRERYQLKRITSCNTNLSPDELIDYYTKSIADKINHGTYWLEFKGKSKR